MMLNFAQLKPDGPKPTVKCNGIHRTPPRDFVFPKPPQVTPSSTPTFCNNTTSDSDSTQSDSSCTRCRPRHRSKRTSPMAINNSLLRTSQCTNSYSPKTTQSFLPPIGVFWDIENCHVPKGCSAVLVAQVIRDSFFDGYREAEFVVVCDVTRESQKVIKELSDAQVNLIHVPSLHKNAADEKLRQSMRRFADIHCAPAAVVLITGDINFIADVCDLRHRRKLHVILLHRENTSEALISAANENHDFKMLFGALPPRIDEQNGTEEYSVIVYDLPGVEVARIKNRLKRISENCGGKVTKVGNDGSAVIVFKSEQLAVRAVKRMDGVDVCGNKISLSDPQRVELRDTPTGRLAVNQLPRSMFAPPSVPWSAFVPSLINDIPALMSSRPMIPHSSNPPSNLPELMDLGGTNLHPANPLPVITYRANACPSTSWPVTDQSIVKPIPMDTRTIATRAMDSPKINAHLTITYSINDFLKYPPPPITDPMKGRILNGCLQNQQTMSAFAMNERQRNVCTYERMQPGVNRQLSISWPNVRMMNGCPNVNLINELPMNGFVKNQLPMITFPMNESFMKESLMGNSLAYPMNGTRNGPVMNERPMNGFVNNQLQITYPMHQKESSMGKSLPYPMNGLRNVPVMNERLMNGFVNNQLQITYPMNQKESSMGKSLPYPMNGLRNVPITYEGPMNGFVNNQHQITYPMNRKESSMGKFLPYPMNGPRNGHLVPHRVVQHPMNPCSNHGFSMNPQQMVKHPMNGCVTMHRPPFMSPMNGTMMNQHLTFSHPGNVWAQRPMNGVRNGSCRSVFAGVIDSTSLMRCLQTAFSFNKNTEPVLSRTFSQLSSSIPSLVRTAYNSPGLGSYLDFLTLDKTMARSGTQIGNKTPGSWKSPDLMPPPTANQSANRNRGSKQPQLVTAKPIPMVGNSSRKLTPSPYNGSRGSSWESPQDDQERYFHPIGVTTPKSVPIELQVTNLDQSIEPKDMKKILMSVFGEHVMVLHVSVFVQSDGQIAAHVKVGSLQDAQYAISKLHRRKVGYRRIIIAYASSVSGPSPQLLRSQIVALLQEVPTHRLPLFKFCELFESRYLTSVSVSGMYKMRDVCLISDDDKSGRTISLNPDHRQTPSPAFSSGQDMELAYCPLHMLRPGPDKGWAEQEVDQLPNVRIGLKLLTCRIHALVQAHKGAVPLPSLARCYEAQFSPLVADDSGVPLEHLLSCLPGVEITQGTTAVKYLRWAQQPDNDEPGKCASPPLAAQQTLFAHELADLLKTSPHCQLPFNRFIPMYHHHFGRQCRVADYGYTKLADLLEALPHIVQVLGEGNRRVMTLAHRAQVRRFTSDLLRLLKAQASKQVALSEFAAVYLRHIGKEWDIVDYGVCDLADMLSEVSQTTVSVTRLADDVIISIPRHEQTPEEAAKTRLFAQEVVELLSHAPQCQLQFNKFIPAYHHHFGRQCRLADYGYTKLVELFEAIPHVAKIIDGGGDGERQVSLTTEESLKVLVSQMIALLCGARDGCMLMAELPVAFKRMYGFALKPDTYGCKTVAQVVALMHERVKVECSGYAGQIVSLVDNWSANHEGGFNGYVMNAVSMFDTAPKPDSPPKMDWSSATWFNSSPLPFGPTSMPSLDNYMGLPVVLPLFETSVDPSTTNLASPCKSLLHAHKYPAGIPLNIVAPDASALPLPTAFSTNVIINEEGTGAESADNSNASGRSTPSRVLSKKTRIAAHFSSPIES